MNTIKSKSWTLGLAILAVCVGCSKSDNNGGTDNGGVGDRYFIAAASGEYTYTIAVDDIEKDTTITKQTPGTIENLLSFTQFGYNGKNAVIAINYRQGQPAPGYIFQLNTNGQLRKTDDFTLDAGFNTLGSFDKYLAVAANGETLTGTNDGKKGSVFYLVDLQDDNKILTKPIVTERFIGDRTASFTGITDAGSGNFYSGVSLDIPTVTSGAPVPVSRDSVFVAKFDANLNLIRIYDDNRLSFSQGTMRSARYNQIANDSNGDTYVFSTGYNIDGGAVTTKKAGALLIKKDASDFDASYYFDIETASGGYKFRKVWSVAEDYFLLEMYNDPGAKIQGKQDAANQFAIVRMSTKEFKWIRSGFPEVATISSSGVPYAADGKAYVSIVTPDTQPTVYVIDPKTATAKKGITVSGVTSIPGLGKLSPQSTVQ